MSEVESICDTIGRQRLAVSLGVSKAAVSNAIADRKFPPKWYRVVRALCLKNGIDCPDSVFGMIEPQDAEGDDVVA